MMAKSKVCLIMFGVYAMMFLGVQCRVTGSDGKNRDPSESPFFFGADVVRKHFLQGFFGCFLKLVALGTFLGNLGLATRATKKGVITDKKMYLLQDEGNKQAYEDPGKRR